MVKQYLGSVRHTCRVVSVVGDTPVVLCQWLETDLSCCVSGWRQTCRIVSVVGDRPVVLCQWLETDLSCCVSG